jgi:hypothetical protein
VKGIRIKGVVVAAVVVLAVDIVAGIGLTLMLGSRSLQSEKAVTALTTSTPFLLGSLILGTLSTVQGGFVAARIAKTRHYTNAAVIGAIGIILSVLLAGEYPLWFDAVAFLLVLPAALLGGHLAIPPKQGNA